MIDFILNILVAGLFPNLGHRGRARRAKRRFLTQHFVTFPGAMRFEDGTEQAGYLRVTASSFRLSLDRDGIFRPAEKAFDEFDSYSTQDNGSIRRKSRVMPSALPWWIILRLTGPTGTVAVAYDPAYHSTVRDALQGVGIREDRME